MPSPSWPPTPHSPSGHFHLIFSKKSVSSKQQMTKKKKKNIFIVYHNVSVKYPQSKAESPWRDAARLASTSAPGLNFPLAKCLCSSESVNKKIRGEETHTDRCPVRFGQDVVLLRCLPTSPLFLALPCHLVSFLLCHLCVHFGSSPLAWNALLP